MREALRHDVATGLHLQSVVTDRACRVDALLDISSLEKVSCAVRLPGPNASKAIGLQFKSDGKLIGSGLIAAFSLVLHPIHDAKQVLHVMPDLMGDHVSFREVAGGMEAIAQLTEKIEIQINTLIAG